ncbi:uncharacterized protein F5Z01DRAFT_677187 [Emericellopsis atlantica]|uniref:Uncharacterized protein n=1 Tax=Emericellopsis atlantica TaxID=2614577 RepID=A0A9P7ZG43_9HYPO|nr:uncharacterized protein F5Z01DRAFT_677187 [Emericellopsis atlantica]KAG9251197.1 hypothetical protein F5Z01DRAFT_677187 [Emericellopsis atlantica]
MKYMKYMPYKLMGPTIPTQHYVVQGEPGKPTALIAVPEPRRLRPPLPPLSPEEKGILAPLKTDHNGFIKTRRRAHFGAPNNPFPIAHLMTTPTGATTTPGVATGSSATPSTGAFDTPSRGGTTARTARGRPRSNAVSIPSWVTHPQGEAPPHATTTARTARGRPRANAVSLPRGDIPPQHESEELTAAEWRMRVRLAAIRERHRLERPVTPPPAIVIPVYTTENLDWQGYSRRDGANGTSLQAQVEASWRVFDEYMASIQQ